MTPNDMHDKVERYLNKNNLDMAHITDGIEEAVNWLGNMGYVIDTLVADYQGKDFYKLPPDIINIIKIEDTEEEEFVEDYNLEGRLIRFAEPGKYRIFAERQPSVPQPTEEFNLHNLLQYCILDYVKGFCKVSIDDRSEDGHRLMQKFQKDSVKAYQSIVRRRSSPAQWTVVRGG